MSSIILCIIAILALLLIAFMIYLLLEKSFGKAILLILMLVISVVLGELAENLHNWVDNNPFSIMQSGTSNANNIVENALGIVLSFVLFFFRFIFPSTSSLANIIMKQWVPINFLRFMVIFMNTILVAKIVWNHWKNQEWEGEIGTFLKLYILLFITNINIPFILASSISIFCRRYYELHFVFLCLLVLVCAFILFLEIYLLSDYYYCEDVHNTVINILYIVCLCIFTLEILIDINIFGSILVFLQSIGRCTFKLIDPSTSSLANMIKEQWFPINILRFIGILMNVILIAMMIYLADEIVGEEVDIILLALLIIANINAPYILAFIMSIGYQGTYTLHIIFLWLLLGLSCLIIIVLEIRLVTNSYLCDKFGHRVSKMLYMLFLCILIREILM